MGSMIAHMNEDMSERGEIARAFFENPPDLDEIHRKIELVRERDAGYRGAAPYTELINARVPTLPPPQYATFIAVDGSQIYPSQHASALYYLTNIGIFIHYHGGDELPREESEPRLYYTDKELRENNGHGAIIKNTAVNARRTVIEMQELMRICWEHTDDEAPLIGVMDGRLLFWLGKEIPDAKKLEADYNHTLQAFHDIHLNRQKTHGHNASLIGYVERGDSRFVIRLLHLLRLDDDDVIAANLETAGEFEGLSDEWLFRSFLKPGERSAIMIQQSPQNKDYRKNLGDPYEITFFYLNVGSFTKPNIVRIELPMWVAQSEEAVDELHSMLVAQCALTGRYPYALTRAHELAVVSNFEKRQLEEMINVELLKHRQEVEISPKQTGKDQTRAPRTRYGQPTKKG